MPKLHQYFMAFIQSITSVCDVLELKDVRLEVSRDYAEFKFRVIFSKNRPRDTDFDKMRFRQSK